MDQLGLQNVQGRVRAHSITEGKHDREVWTPTTEFSKNLVLNQWATIVSHLLTAGDARYRIQGLYLEYENVASPGDTVSAGTFDRTRDVTYYDDLVGSSVRDYLRVPMTASTLESEGVAFADNLITFFGRSSGTSGVHGKPFSDTVNSTIFGASLVAFVDNNDATQDLLLSSFYFEIGDQQPKLATSQIGIEWQLQLQ